MLPVDMLWMLQVMRKPTGRNDWGDSGQLIGRRFTAVFNAHPFQWWEADAVVGAGVDVVVDVWKTCQVDTELTGTFVSL